MVTVIWRPSGPTTVEPATTSGMPLNPGTLIVGTDPVLGDDSDATYVNLEQGFTLPIATTDSAVGRTPGMDTSSYDWSQLLSLRVFVRAQPDPTYDEFHAPTVVMQEPGVAYADEPSSLFLLTGVPYNTSGIGTYEVDYGEILGTPFDPTYQGIFEGILGLDLIYTSGTSDALGTNWRFYDFWIEMDFPDPSIDGTDDGVRRIFI